MGGVCVKIWRKMVSVWVCPVPTQAECFRRGGQAKPDPDASKSLNVHSARCAFVLYCLPKELQRPAMTFLCLFFSAMINTAKSS